MKLWYVVAVEPKEGDSYINVFGPFLSRRDARRYAVEVDEDNGWLSVKAKSMTAEEAASLATDYILWPYDSKPGGQ